MSEADNMVFCESKTAVCELKYGAPSLGTRQCFIAYAAGRQMRGLGGKSAEKQSVGNFVTNIARRNS